MPDALVGYTGFVGSNLASQHHFEACFNSKNIEAIRGQHFDRLVVSGMPAAKWIANGDPLGDLAILDRLWSSIALCQAREVVIVSTVDVYPTPMNVDEDTRIEPNEQQPYGLNRQLLEERAANHFPRVLAVRLPGLYGPGLKKNAVYDLLHDNETHKIPAEGSFQFYNLERIGKDIETAFGAGLSLVNFATEPVTVREVARHAFGIEFANDLGRLPPCYDVRTNHAAIFGGSEGYLESRAQVLDGLKSFVDCERIRLLKRVAA